ncbi:MAG: DUF255 domain-containing protein, partial [Candidatus Eremiobacterota bacterium]
MRRTLLTLVLGLSLTAGASGDVEWQPWSEAAFERAARENKLVLLDVEAVWCHWCHVMDETTYADPGVAELLARHYVCVKVDQDARPDIANRYRDYGWPATVLFKPDGTELVKLEGYVKPERMKLILARFRDNPVPEEAAPAEQATAPASGLPPGLRQELHDWLVERYDRQRGGWGRVHKFLNPDNLEYCLEGAARGDAQLAFFGRETLDRQKLLMDPAWGGVYQYSHGGTWENPHFEKIMSTQTDNLRTYAMAYELWGDPDDLAVARSIRGYLKTFLTGPEGAFYTSQDADLVQGKHSEDYFKLSDRERRARGVPRVDTHRYARENGWAIRSLAVLYGATGDPEVLQDAQSAAEWVLRERSLPGGGFRHDAVDRGGPFLGDTLACGRAFLELYAVTGDSRWLENAVAAADFIERNFTQPGGGFATA